MRRYINFIVCLSLITALFSGCAYTPTKEQLSPYVSRIQSEYRYDYSGKTLRQIVALPDEEFDLMTASLYLAKEIYPSIDVDGYLTQIENLSAELEYSLKDKKSYKAKVNAISDLVWRKGYIAYKPFWQNYNTHRFRDLWYYEYSSVPLLLDTHKGNCVSFSILYLALAKRAGLPLYGVVIPGHIFVRYYDGKNERNIEPLDNSFCYPDKTYQETANLPDQMCAEGKYYLNRLSDKEVFGTLLLNMSSMAYDNNETIRALRYMNTALKSNPRDPEILTCAGITHLKLNNIENSLHYFDKVLEINPNSIVVLSQKALLMRSFGDMEESEKLFRKTLGLTPVRMNEWFNKGVAYFYFKNFTKAMECFNKSLDLDDKFPAAWYYLAGTYAMLHKKGYSLSCLKTAVDIDPVFKGYAQQDNFFELFKDDKSFMEIIQ